VISSPQDHGIYVIKNPAINKCHLRRYVPVYG